MAERDLRHLRGAELRSYRVLLGMSGPAQASCDEVALKPTPKCSGPSGQCHIISTGDLAQLFYHQPVERFLAAAKAGDRLPVGGGEDAVGVRYLRDFAEDRNGAPDNGTMWSSLFLYLSPGIVQSAPSSSALRRWAAS